MMDMALKDAGIFSDKGIDAGFNPCYDGYGS